MLNKLYNRFAEYTVGSIERRIFAYESTRILNRISFWRGEMEISNLVLSVGTETYVCFRINFDVPRCYDSIYSIVSQIITGRRDVLIVCGGR